MADIAGPVGGGSRQRVAADLVRAGELVDVLARGAGQPGFRVAGGAADVDQLIDGVRTQVAAECDRGRNVVDLQRQLVGRRVLDVASAIHAPEADRVAAAGRVHERCAVLLSRSAVDAVEGRVHA